MDKRIVELTLADFIKRTRDTVIYFSKIKEIGDTFQSNLALYIFKEEMSNFKEHIRRYKEGGYLNERRSNRLYSIANKLENKFFKLSNTCSCRCNHSKDLLI